MKVKIIRAFSRTKQIAPYEPINAFCSAEIESDVQEISKIEIKAYSKELDELCRSEVEKTLKAFSKQDLKKSKDQGRDSAENDVGSE